jgi:hypothetical protein
MIKRGLFARALGTLLAMLLLFLGCSGNQDIPPRTYTISGNVYENFFDLPDVEMILSGDASRTTKTDKDGKYSFTGLPNGNYRVTPYLKDYDFEPTSKDVILNGANKDGIDFRGEKRNDPVGEYSLSGKVVLSGGGVLPDVTIKLSGNDANRSRITDSNGNYSFPNMSDGNYTLTPSLTNYAFTPISRNVDVSGADAIDKNFTATLIPTATYNPSDLAGTWNIQQIRTDGWLRIVLNINGEGDTIFEEYEDSEGNPNPNQEDLNLTIDADGVVGSGLMNMAANKKMMVGSGGVLTISLKAGDDYSETDLNDTAFVYHVLKVGAVNEWRRGIGTIDSGGSINVTSENAPSGAVTPPGIIGTLSVDASGVVSLSGHSTFKGFLSDDKKTVVATETVGGSYVLWVIQITGKTYTTPGTLPDSVANVHMLTGGTVPAPFSAYWTATTFNGTMVASNWDNNYLSAPSPCNPSVDVNRVVTIPGDANHGATHGQLSDDESFIVGTKTLSREGSPFGYALVVYTIK